MTPSAKVSRVGEAPSPLRATAIAPTAATPQNPISSSKASRYPSSSPSAAASEGTTNTGSAPGGYSSPKSRYGTSPFATASP